MTYFDDEKKKNIFLTLLNRHWEQTELFLHSFVQHTMRKNWKAEIRVLYFISIRRLLRLR